MSLRGAAVALLLLGVTLGVVLAFAAPAGAEGESINARLLDNSGKETKPVAGVRIIVRQDGKVIGEAESDADGLAVVPVPARGNYKVRLDSSSVTRIRFGCRSSPCRRARRSS